MKDSDFIQQETQVRDTVGVILIDKQEKDPSKVVEIWL